MHECKKALINPAMLIANLLTFIILLRTFFIHDLFESSKGMDIATLLTFPFAMSTFLPFACIFPILPYAFSFLEERNSHYMQFIIVRSSIKNYIRRKLFFVGLSGGMALAVPFAVLFIMAVCISQNITADNFPYMYIETIWEPFMYIWGGKLFLLMRLLLIFLFGIVWAETALLISLLFSNRYVVFIVTFVIYQLTWMLLPPQLNTAYLFRSDFGVTENTIQMPYIVFGLYIILLTALNYFLMRKRVKEN